MFPLPRDRRASQACSIIFVPEKVHESGHPGGFQRNDGETTRIKMGPLKIAQQARHQLELFCTQPLVLDFMSRKFSNLPALGATYRELLEAEEVQNFRREMLSIQDCPGEDQHDLSNELFAVLAGLHPIFGSMTFLPGAQFILSELVTKPTYCYSVPAVRMVMHLLAYLSMLILFGCNVLLFHEDVGVGEVIFFIYTLVRFVPFMGVISRNKRPRPRKVSNSLANSTVLILKYRVGHICWAFNEIDPVP